jgi:hypothetical protein
MIDSAGGMWERQYKIDLERASQIISTPTCGTIGSTPSHI